MPSFVRLVRFALLFPFLCLFCAFDQTQSQTTYTMICRNSDCTEEMFATEFTRDYDSADENMLPARVKEPVSVVAIRFSHRSDFFMGQLPQSKRRGLCYMSHLDLMPYVFMLEEMLKVNEPIWRVTVDKNTERHIKTEEIPASPELLRVYMKYTGELSIPVHEQIQPQIDALLNPPTDHGGHGHSHDHHGHSHSHGDGGGHGHSHSHEEEVAVGNKEEGAVSKETPPRQTTPKNK